jgi:hypothetical protein
MEQIMCKQDYGGDAGKGFFNSHKTNPMIKEKLVLIKKKK